MFLRVEFRQWAHAFFYLFLLNLTWLIILKMCRLYDSKKKKILKSIVHKIFAGLRYELYIGSYDIKFQRTSFPLMIHENFPIT